MKRILSMFLTLILCLGMNLTTAFASEDSEWELALKTAFIGAHSELLPEGVNKSTFTTGKTRGRYIGSSSISITNEGYGVIGVYADTLAHVSVKKIQMNIYLDRWDATEKDWIQEKQYKFVYNNEDGSEDLSVAMEYFTIEDQPTGYRYRLRGVHGVWSFDGNVETQSTITNGVLIKNGPA